MRQSASRLHHATLLQETGGLEPLVTRPRPSTRQPPCPALRGAGTGRRFFSLTRCYIPSLHAPPSTSVVSPSSPPAAGLRSHRPPVPLPPSPTMATTHGLALRLPLLLTVLLLVALALPTSSVAAAGRSRPAACTYTLRVKTACGSPAARTNDAVSVAFGDAYRNEVLARRLPTTGGTALERCGTDTFRVAGPCGYGVCYLYLRRAGREGWAPEWVQVVQPGPRRDPPPTATFYFGDPLPDGVWYGHDRCPKAAAAAADAAATNSSASSPRG